MEQNHIAMALTFELSKVETPVISEHIVYHLLNIDANLAETVTGKLGVLVANGTDAPVLKDIRHAAKKEGAMMELVAPTVGGFEASSGD